ncbi:MAG: UDP-N-acetylmuramate--L-alanine ligase [Bacteroidales bacterium]
MKSIEQVKHVYFLGIGGIGMSALALFFLHRKCKVSGYDRVHTPITEELQKRGADIHFVESVDLLPKDIDLVIYTPAIPDIHVEWSVLREKNIPICKRSEILGLITCPYKTLAVAGTHGKTTISTLVAFLLHKTIGCNAFLGGISKNFESNFLFSEHSKYMVVEADEYDRSFLHLHPWFSLVTSMDPDHLDIYGNAACMQEAYAEFMSQTDKAGGVILKYGLNPNLKSKYTYALQSSEDNSHAVDAYADNIRIKNGAYIFDYIGPKMCIKDLVLNYPGLHNVENAVAAITLVAETEITAENIKTVLPLFKGVKRRFDEQIKRQDFLFIDDYAHHPKEIKACLNSLKELYPNKKISLLFQPHLYSRTKDLAEDFADSLSMADELILLDIYPARELPIEGITSHIIGDKVFGIPVYYVSKGDVLKFLERNIKTDILVSMGAGDIDRLVPVIKDLYEK